VKTITPPADVLLVADFFADFPFLTDAGVTETKPAFTALSMRLALGVLTAGLFFADFPFLIDAGVTDTRSALNALSTIGVFNAGLCLTELLSKRFTDFSAERGVFRTI
jgi:hypothetical protein